MIKRALEAGVHPRVEISRFEQAEPYMDLGVRHFCIGWDIRTVYVWAKEQGAAMRDLLAGGEVADVGDAAGAGDPYRSK
jgi:4-hydroxy-2-oxoheptanedioate aldolase